MRFTWLENVFRRYPRPHEQIDPPESIIKNTRVKIENAENVRRRADPLIRDQPTPNWLEVALSGQNESNSTGGDR